MCKIDNTLLLYSEEKVKIWARYYQVFSTRMLSRLCDYKYILLRYFGMHFSQKERKIKKYRETTTAYIFFAYITFTLHWEAI